MSPSGTIVFSTVGRPHYGFDIFSVQLPPELNQSTDFSEHCLTDGASINFNGHFVDDDKTIVYISERTGSAQIFLNRLGGAHPDRLHSTAENESLFHDRPAVNNGRLYFISAHEQPENPFTSWSALYSAALHDKGAARLTPYGSVDFSPAISPSGKLIAVASYGSKRWSGEFHDLLTDIVVFSDSDPASRVLVCEHGGWPSWCGEATLYFHRQAEDGWWSVFRADLPHDSASSIASVTPLRLTPPGVHCFSPAAVPNSAKIAVATRRKGKNYRHIEIFDTESQKFYPVTELINPDFHHYNPFVSPGANFLGYHRFRGGGGAGTSTIPHLDPISSRVESLRMLRINGSFPAFSPSGDFIAFNGDFDQNAGLRIIRSDGSKRWTLFKNRTTFSNSWSPANGNVIFTSIGPVFASENANVQIARVEFDESHLSNDHNEIDSDIKILTKEDTGNNAFPSSSPDGRSVVFRSGRSGYKNLYIVDAIKGEFDGGIRQVTEGPWIDTMPSWSPDGKTIAFSSNRHQPDDPRVFGIYLMNADGTEVRRFAVAGMEEERERLNHVSFSADGEWLLFTANLGGVTAEPVALPNQYQPYGELYVVRMDGSGLQRLTWNGYENGVPAWHPRGLCDDDEEVNNLSVSSENANANANGDVLEGRFVDPLWLKCDF